MKNAQGFLIVTDGPKQRWQLVRKFLTAANRVFWCGDVEIVFDGVEPPLTTRTAGSQSHEPQADSLPCKARKEAMDSE